ncbi:hypothetical protein MANES_17G003400v8 [Manihot esculenta]|uniref:Uncharacterized protein n=1 Tax=Manihot esculenta TaxID=3983 RepID=A0ACB7G2E0_MANES|nr:hypothetical protein MANES_17G003400v8 [Manihot esculenta]
MGEGKGFASEMYRNTSEELFLKSLMDSSVPTMEMLGFKNISSSHPHNFRTDSEELFKSWLTNGENHGYNSSSIAHRTRQASRRISTELATLTSQQPGSSLQKKRSNDVLFTQNNTIPDGTSSDLNIRNAVERSMQAWFHSSQPMTRSRSSELRKRYAAMQSAQTSLGNGVNDLKQEFADPNGFIELPMHDIGNQLGSFMSPSNSSSSTFNTPQMGDADKVSSVVNMLKGTLERKKLSNQKIEKEAVEDSSNAIYHDQQVIMNSPFDQVNGNSIYEIPQTFQEISSDQVKDAGGFQTVQGPIDLDLEGFVHPTNAIQLCTVSREPSQSESSAAAPVFSSGFDACDGPSNSSQTLSICESSRKQVGNNTSPENGPKAKDFRERIIENLKDDRKRGGLVRYGSVTSGGSGNLYIFRTLTA